MLEAQLRLQIYEGASPMTRSPASESRESELTATQKVSKLDDLMLLAALRNWVVNKLVYSDEYQVALRCPASRFLQRPAFVVA